MVAVDWGNIRSVTLDLLMIICIFLTSFLFLSDDLLGRSPDGFSSTEQYTSTIRHTESETQPLVKLNGIKIIAMVFCEASIFNTSN